MMSSEGLLLVISGPSGCGKGTVCELLKQRNPDMRVSVSATTRDIRRGEREGVTYFYKTKQQFEEMIQKGQLLEYACGYSGNYYGTPKAYVQEQLAQGNDVILEIEIQGAMQVKKKFDTGVFIFLVPPSMEELYSRLTGRGRESMELIRERFLKAAEEMKCVNDYGYVVVNDTVQEAVEKIEAILTAEKCRTSRNQAFLAQLIP